MKRKLLSLFSVFLLVVIVSVTFLPAPVKAESTINCPAGTVDMLDWMTLDADLRASKHLTGTHPLYTLVWPDKFWWLKGDNGQTWDVNLYDANNIYWWITENAWNTPRDFKKAHSDKNFRASPRCAKTGFPGTTIQVSDTSYDIYKNCNFVAPTNNLKKVVFEVWGPYNVSLGGSLPANMPVLRLSYRWNCDNTYNNCDVKEVYWLSQRYGLVRWQQFNLDPNTHQYPANPTSESTFNNLVSGTINQNFPCF